MLIASNLNLKQKKAFINGIENYLLSDTYNELNWDPFLPNLHLDKHIKELYGAFYKDGDKETKAICIDSIKNVLAAKKAFYKVINLKHFLENDSLKELSETALEESLEAQFEEQKAWDRYSVEFEEKVRNTVKYFQDKGAVVVYETTTYKITKREIENHSSLEMEFRILNPQVLGLSEDTPLRIEIYDKALGFASRFKESTDAKIEKLEKEIFSHSGVIYTNSKTGHAKDGISLTYSGDFDGFMSLIEKYAEITKKPEN